MLVYSSIIGRYMYIDVRTKLQLEGGGANFFHNYFELSLKLKYVNHLAYQGYLEVQFQGQCLT